MQNHSLHNALHKAAVDHHFSGVISIIERGNQIFEAAYGLADRSNTIPNRCDTRFGTRIVFYAGAVFGFALRSGRLGRSALSDEARIAAGIIHSAADLSSVNNAAPASRFVR